MMKRLASIGVLSLTAGGMMFGATAAMADTDPDFHTVQTCHGGNATFTIPFVDINVGNHGGCSDHSTVIVHHNGVHSHSHSHHEHHGGSFSQYSHQESFSSHGDAFDADITVELQNHPKPKPKPEPQPEPEPEPETEGKRGNC